MYSQFISPEDLLLVSFIEVICENCSISFSPVEERRERERERERENSFVTSALSDIVTGYLDEINTTFIRLKISGVLTQTSVRAEDKAVAT